MDSKVNSLIASVRRALWVLRRRRWTAMATAWVVVLVSALFVAVVPERFEASSRIYVDTQTVLKPMMVGLAYQPDIDQQVRMLARTLISRPNIERLLDVPEAGFKFNTAREREATLNRLMEQIKIVAAERGNLYTISYRDPDAARALQVVEGTVTLFVNSGAGGKKQDSLDAGRFIDEQIQSNEAKLIEAERRLKDFKVRNFGMSGVSNQDYFVRMSALSDEVAKLGNDLRAAEKARDTYRRELAAEDPQLPPDSLPPKTPVLPSEIDARLDAQRRALDELARRYTDDHPDVIAARRLITQLERQKSRPAEASPAAPIARPSGTAATSPVYQKIRISLAESEAQVASLQSQLTAQQARLADVRALAGRVPQVEAELAQINRDYDVLRKNYDQLVARRESASLGVKLDESSQLAEFRLVEPPRVSPKPVFPGRLQLAMASLVGALLLALAMVMVLDVVDPTLDSARLLERLSGRPVLGVVSRAKTFEFLAAERRDQRRFIAATALLLCLQLGWIAWMLQQSMAR